MKKLLLVIALIATGTAQAASTAAPTTAPTPVATDSSEDWKGQPDTSEVNLGAIAGLGIVDFNAGFTLLGTASKKIVHHGFIDEINDSVSIETELGPVFVSGTTIFSYSLHLRWDFQMNDKWTFYALGGLGGYIAGSGFNSNNFVLFPRFGVGGFYRVNDLILIRGEISHEVIAAGVAIPFYL